MYIYSLFLCLWRLPWPKTRARYRVNINEYSQKFFEIVMDILKIFPSIKVVKTRQKVSFSNNPKHPNSITNRSKRTFQSWYCYTIHTTKKQKSDDRIKDFFQTYSKFTSRTKYLYLLSVTALTIIITPNIGSLKKPGCLCKNYM